MAKAAGGGDDHRSSEYVCVRTTSCMQRWKREEAELLEAAANADDEDEARRLWLEAGYRTLNIAGWKTEDYTQN